MIDVLGARIVAAEQGIEYRDLRFKKQNVEQLPFRQRLTHTVAVNGFVASLMHACRHSDAHLVEWLSEKRCKVRYAGVVNPDGYGILAIDGVTRSFFLEMDLDSESRPRLAGKLIDYEEASALADVADIVVFCFPTSAREASARKVLRSPGLPLATTTIDRFERDPLGRIWLPIDADVRVPICKVGT